MAKKEQRAGNGIAKVRGIISGRDEVCQKQLVPEVFIWGRETILQEHIWVQVVLDWEGLGDDCWEGGDCNKAEELMEKGVLCSPSWM